MMNKTIGLMAAVLLLAVSPAKASTFWSFSYADTFGGITAYGSGTFETPTAGPGYLSGITGSANGSAITGLSGYAGADNYFYTPGFPADVGGISFTTSGGPTWNLTSYAGNSILRSDTDPGGYGAYAQSIAMTVTQVPVTPVPEPETYAMMLAGLGLLGLVRRRKQQQAAA